MASPCRFAKPTTIAMFSYDSTAPVGFPGLMTTMATGSAPSRRAWTMASLSAASESCQSWASSRK